MNGASGRDSLTFSVFRCTAPWGPRDGWGGRAARRVTGGAKRVTWGGEAGCPGGTRRVTAHNPRVVGTRTKWGKESGARGQGQVTACPDLHGNMYLTFDTSAVNPESGL